MFKLLFLQSKLCANLNSPSSYRRHHRHFQDALIQFNMDSKKKGKKKSSKAKAKENIVEPAIEEEEMKKEDLEAVEEMIERLVKKSEFSEDSIRSQYKSFMSVCPEGQMTKEKFLSLSQQVLGDEAEFLVEALFRVFDDDKSGSIDFEEFILALNATKFIFTIKETSFWLNI